jgi:hypothetical protein
VADLTRLPPGYPALLEELKTRIRFAQLPSALTLNQETIRLYWSIGQDLSSRFAAEGWGTKVVDRLAKDLGTDFPGGGGFQPPQPSLHAFLRRGVARSANFAACCKIAVGSSHGPSRPSQGWRKSGMVPAGVHRTRLEPQRSYPSHLYPVA